MARPYSVTPVRRLRPAFYVATFRNARNDRVTRGLGTSDPDRARLVCAGLLALLSAAASPPPAPPRRPP